MANSVFISGGKICTDNGKVLIGSAGSAKPEQTKSVTPSAQSQAVVPDTGYTLSAVMVNPIPSNYGLITYNGFELTVS